MSKELMKGDESFIEVSEQIKRFVEFFEENYKEDLLKRVREDKRFLVVDFSEFSKFDPDLANLLLDQPEDVIKAAELAIEQFDLNVTNFRVRFTNLLENQRIMIRDIRSIHIGKFFVICGVVRQKSDVRPQVTAAKFECPSCGNITNVLQLDSSFKEPTRCGCGRKGKFRLLSKDLVDAQSIVLEEAPEDLEGGEQPKRINILLKEDLVSPMSEKKTNPGSKISVIGVIKDVPIISKTGGKSTRFDLIVEANYVEALEETFFEMEVSEEEERKIKEIAADTKVYSKLTASIAPSIYGYDKIKEALLLQLVGGVRKVRKDKVVSRGDMHVLLVGDPGAGKSALLRRINLIAPKGRYISGKGISAAGLTASVVRDEFLRGWSLEAGAMVLSSNGLCCIDELDKMSAEDTSAMHEALENQSYHPDTEILFSDGKVKKIGPFVDDLLKKNKNKIINGKNCEILKTNDIELLTTDFNKIFPIKASMVSRHKSPNYFIKVTYDNGRCITVTPEHPVFIFKEGKIDHISAEDIKIGMLAPTPRRYPTKSKQVKLSPVELTHHNNKKVFFPSFMDKQLSKLLGYIVTEGHCYYNPNTRYAEVGVSNTDSRINSDVKSLFTNIFKTTVNVNTRKAENCRKATLDMDTVRCCSVPVYKFFFENFNGMTTKSKQKRISNKIRMMNINLQKEFLRAAFKGDGFIDSGRFGFSTASYGLAKDYQDILLQHSVDTKIDKETRGENDYYKVVVRGTKSMQYFYDNITEKKDKRILRIKNFCEKSKNRLNQRDPVPNEIIVEINKLLKNFGLSDGYFYNIIRRNQNSQRNVVLKYLGLLKRRIDICKKNITSNSSRDIRRKANIRVKDIAKKLSVSTTTIYNIENKKERKRYNELLHLVKTLAKKKVSYLNRKLQSITKFVNSDIKLIKIKKIEKIENKDIKWVYDITVKPTRTFVSEGLVLHNTVSISKANIQATLLARTTVLAAANPKFGRFDPYGIIADQINLSPTLINRFDLIFTIKDLPDETRDKEMAAHMLRLHQNPDIMEPEIPTELLRKFIAYVKQKTNPKLTEGAIQEIQDYYIKMRMSGGGEEGIKTIPISPRQLEALVRLSEASARIRLSNRVTKKDARKAIELLEYSLMQVGFDKETGKIDIDRIATGIAASQRSNIVTIKEIIKELEGMLGKTIPIDDIIKEAKSKGIDEDKAEEAIERLKRWGDVFEPRRGFLSLI